MHRKKGVKSVKFIIDLHQVFNNNPLPRISAHFFPCDPYVKHPIKPFQTPSTFIPNPKPSTSPHGAFRWQHSQAGHRRGSSTARSNTTTDTGAQSNSKSNAQSYGSSNTNTYTNTLEKPTADSDLEYDMGFFGLFCRGIFFDGLSMVELKFPCLVVCGLVHGRDVFSGFCMLGDASGRFGCCPVGFGCCGTRDASVMVFGFSWCFVWSFLFKEEKNSQVLAKSHTC